MHIAAALLVCGTLAYGAWRAMGWVGVVLSAPIFGAAVARPLLELVGAIARGTKALALGSTEGRHYAFRGQSIDITEDDAPYRWLLTDDVRKVIVDLPSDKLLQRLYPDGLHAVGRPAAMRIQAEALADYLRKSSDPTSIRFKRWVERDVLLPARKRREVG